MIIQELVIKERFAVGTLNRIFLGFLNLNDKLRDTIFNCDIIPKLTSRLKNCDPR
jgi:hypothetical protein